MDGKGLRRAVGGWGEEGVSRRAGSSERSGGDRRVGGQAGVVAWATLAVRAEGCRQGCRLRMGSKQDHGCAPAEQTDWRGGTMGAK